MPPIDRRNFLRHAGALGAAAPFGAGILGGFQALADAAPPEKTEVPAALLTPAEAEYLKLWDAPTIANALEREKVRSAAAGFMDHGIRPIFPELGAMVGYAATATIKASEPRKEGDAYVDRFEYYEYIQSIPAPRVMVIHDLDAPRPVGSFWGEVHGNLHRALGCIGVITDGGVRDLPWLRMLRFHCFTPAVLVSHVHVHLVDFGKPVSIGGHTVRSGDLLFGDEHGVIDVPHSHAKRIGKLCHDVYMSERPAIDFYKSADFSIEKLREFFNKRR